MFEHLKSLAEQYQISLDDVISISLNRYGIRTTETEDNRLRFNLKFSWSLEPKFFAVCVNTYPDSPFVLKNETLFLENQPIAKVFGIEKDTCTETYFRNGKKVITLNSNSRSNCTGCKFCGTYQLTGNDAYDFSNSIKVTEFFKNLLIANQLDDMNKIENITVCTGCFPNEDALVKHLLDLKAGTAQLNFNGSINYIGSQLRDFEKLKLLKDEIGDFGLYLTLEKFLDRDKFMRPEKASLTLEKAKTLLEYTKSIDITTTFLYILGLENLEIVNTYMNYFKDSINKYPIVQIFQDYTCEQERFRVHEANDIEYYLKARQMISDIFKDYDFAPKHWENFRGLYSKEAILEKRR